MRDSRKFCLRGSNFATFFYDWVPNNTISSSSSARQRNDPAMNAGLVILSVLGDLPQYCEETLYFCNFSGCSDPLPPPPLDLRMLTHVKVGRLNILITSRGPNEHGIVEKLFRISVRIRLPCSHFGLFFLTDFFFLEKIKFYAF